MLSLFNGMEQRAGIVVMCLQQEEAANASRDRAALALEGKTMSPNPGPWNETIVVQLPDAERVEVIGNAREAHDILLRRWPSSLRSASHASAVTACAEVLSGNAPAYLSRIAFLRAVEEAGVKASGL